MAISVTQEGLPAKPKPERQFRIGPWIWAGPAIVWVGVFLFWPVINTLWTSLLNSDGSSFVGLKNYKFVFTDPAMLEVLRNNVLWLVLATAGTVVLGLVIAVLVDRVRIERVVKAAIFIPAAISFVGASVIWKFVYAYAPAGQSQIGLLNATITGLGFKPVAWITTPGINNLALIAIYVWMWTGFCMVIISAALKGIPTEILEAARVDGAGELTIFFRVIIPMIAPTLAVVTTVMIVNVLKIFDVIYVMTGGSYGTNVIAMAYYQALYIINNNGLASALAVVLLLAIIPVMIFNVRRFRAQEAQR